ncbi:tripartite tricarboxylate transporter permease [Halalkalibacterium halodurans]|uniref:BH2009 protein n=1 Tax=Halalkalibacterium halodurans (strain ATCC BAA-125 / DSM 18197 / FERM 7344 / JCM 9153 / C-125) TaxID=272558 RepID=Q9KBB9_HALH5|nr:tripartite tricarboxylate transporter permease [Halalkalibacterium halodurans]MDY7222568.1 tripartite tricarboxylate transporter permease [Halalkalibacterium halodurans]MDY7241789.1 tripartite tricarboxylate transporter permease [Halalkalibacterium halodurans]MED4123957.1 tripartite tricarboxylate transporter permease [Halalkalibacterium halodurans]BAB05728.1 BH2009 [Halalkalibacterium halodurans C-125]
MMEHFFYGLTQVFEWQNLLYMLLGVIAGIVVGGLPGLSVTIALALMLPFTFGMPASTAMLLMLGVYCAGTYGGSIGAILLKTPGTPASAATAADGFALSQQGKAGRALNISLYASVIGGLVSGLVLLFVSPQIASFALKFGPPEYFMLALFGLTIVAGVSGQSLIKGLITACFGMLIATIGLDPMTGSPRFTFEQTFLQSGIPLIPALIGLFAISEIMNQSAKRREKISTAVNFQHERFGWKHMFPFRKTIIKSSFIGVIIGAIPGTGGSIASFLSVNEAQRVSKKPKEFGNGSEESVAAAEAGNNGTTGATLIPMMTLGVPGDVITAVLLSALLIQGLQPGPQLFQSHGDLVYTVMVGFIVVNIIMFIVGKLAIRWFAKVTILPSSVLFPVVLMFCLIGSYAYNYSFHSVWIAIVFGLIGYMLPKFGFPVIPILIGMILGPMAERSLRQALVLSEGSLFIFIERPLALTFLILIILSIFLPMLRKAYDQKHQEVITGTKTEKM